MDEEAADTLANGCMPEPPVSPLPAPIVSWTREEEAGGGQGGAPQGGRLWQDELPRWLASLNPGRTTREYEKAVAYFFETPGVPQYVCDLAFDLLLAYRGALALRATPHAEGAAAPRAPLVSRHAAPAARAEGARLAGRWGGPRAARQGRAASAAQPAGDTHEGQATRSRSRSGLTGARTAERDHALIALALATGLRSIELASLDVGDIVRERHGDHEAWWLVLPDVKTKGQHGGRTLPLAPDLVETLTAYLAATDRRWERAEDRKTSLFLAGMRWQPCLSLRHILLIVHRVETQWLALRSAQDAICAVDR